MTVFSRLYRKERTQHRNQNFQHRPRVLAFNNNSKRSNVDNVESANQVLWYFRINVQGLQSDVTWQILGAGDCAVEISKPSSARLGGIPRANSSSQHLHRIDCNYIHLHKSLYEDSGYSSRVSRPNIGNFELGARDRDRWMEIIA